MKKEKNIEDWLVSVQEAAETFSKVFSEYKLYIPELEPAKPIIRPSGKTWVKRENSIDYLWTDPVNKADSGTDSYNKRTWKAIGYVGAVQLLEITDEIAKLRPILITGFSREKLYAVDDGDVITGVGAYPVEDYRLATVDDLEGTE